MYIKLRIKSKIYTHPIYPKIWIASYNLNNTSNENVQAKIENLTQNLKQAAITYQQLFCIKKYQILPSNTEWYLTFRS